MPRITDDKFFVSTKYVNEQLDNYLGELDDILNLIHPYVGHCDHPNLSAADVRLRALRHSVNEHRHLEDGA